MNNRMIFFFIVVMAMMCLGVMQYQEQETRLNTFINEINNGVNYEK